MVKKKNLCLITFLTQSIILPIAMQTEIQSGPAKGVIAETSFAITGGRKALFSFSMSQGKDKPGNPITFSTIEVNPSFEDVILLSLRKIISQPINYI